MQDGKLASNICLGTEIHDRSPFYSLIQEFDSSTSLMLL